MNDSAAADTFQMQVLVAPMSLLHVLIRGLASLFRNIFDHGALSGQLIQITVNRRDIDLTVLFSEIRVNIRRRNRPVVIFLKKSQDLPAADCRIAVLTHCSSHHP